VVTNILTCCRTQFVDQALDAGKHSRSLPPELKLLLSRPKKTSTHD
jgi:hypothetical protein